MRLRDRPRGERGAGSNPVERTSRDEVARALSTLGTREGRKHVYATIAERAGVELRPASCWLLLRINYHGFVEPALLAERADLPLGVVTAAARQVEERRLARREGMALVLTEQGRQVAARLAHAREESLAELLGDWWGLDRPTDLVALVHELTGELCGCDGERPHDGDAYRPRAGLRRRPV